MSSSVSPSVLAFSSASSSGRIQGARTQLTQTAIIQVTVRGPRQRTRKTLCYNAPTQANLRPRRLAPHPQKGVLGHHALLVHDVVSVASSGKL